MNPRLLTANWVLPVARPPIEHGAIAIGADGRIAAVGPATDWADAQIERFDLGDAVLLPGLVNVHTHPELAAFRGLLDDLPFHEWIPTLMRCKRNAGLTDDDHETAACWTCVEALRAGITTLAATETSGAAIRALRTAGMRGIVYLETFGPAPGQVEQSMAELAALVRQQAPLATDRVAIGVSPHAAYTVSDALYEHVAQFARAQNLPIATHAAEAEAEELLIREGAGPFAAGLRTRGIATPPRAESTIELLDRTGVLALAPLLIHCVRLRNDDVLRIAANGAAVAHCPVANARLGHGTAPLLELAEADVRIGLGTDSVASNNRIDLLEEARAAQLLQRARLQSSGALDGEHLLRLVTIDGARALGLDHRIGTLEAGKDADICALALDRAHNTPPGQITSALFHATRGSDVILTMVQGQVRFDGSRVRSLNEQELRPRVQAVAKRLRAARDCA